MAGTNAYPPPPYGQNVESQSKVSNTGTPRIFHVYHSTFHTNYEVSNENKVPIFYGRTSSFSRTMITLHGGIGRNGPVLAVVNSPMLSSGLKLGLGDPQNPGGMVWEDMTKQSLSHSTYSWQTTIYPNGPGSRGERRAFSWKRTHSVGIEGSSPSIFSDMNFKLVDARTNEVVAVFANNGARSMNKKGKFQINKNYGSGFDIMVVLSALSLIEKARRRRAASGAGGGGGGGGGGG